MNLAELLAARAANRPDAPAIIDDRRGRRAAIAFAEMEAASSRAAGLLYDSGLRPGDAVLVFQPMSIELYIALAALFRLGLVAMFLDPASGREHIERCCALWPPKGLIASAKAHLLRLISPALRRIPVRFAVGMPVPGAASFSRWHCSKPRKNIVDCRPDSPALVTFTSGSTAQPKAALRTNAFLLNQQRVLERILQLQAGEVDLTTMPMFALANLASGVTSVIPEIDLRDSNHAGPSAVLRQMVRWRVDRIGAAPAFLERLTQFCLLRSVVLTDLRKVYTGGGPVFPRLIHELGSVAPQARVSAIYGCTEAEPIALLEQGDLGAKEHRAMTNGAGLLAGRVDRDIQVRILSEGGGERHRTFCPETFSAQCAATGRVGEIVVCGAHVLPSYVPGSGDPETKIHVGNTLWHRTGDAGYLDRAARLWLMGRCCGKVEDQYGTVYPLEVETTIRQLTRSCRAALVSSGGQRALLVERRGADELAQLSKFLDRLHLHQIDIVESLPVDNRHRSKLDYSKLTRPAGKAR